MLWIKGVNQKHLFNMDTYCLVRTFMIVNIFLQTVIVQGQVSVQFVDRAIVVDEGDQFFIRLAKSGTNTEPFNVIVQVENDNDGDLIGGSQVAFFEPGGSQQNAVRMSVADDGLPEGDEVFDLTLYSFDKNKVSIGLRSTMTVTVRASDDAYGVFSFVELSPVIVKEELFTYGKRLKVRRTGASFGTVSLNFVVNSTSDEGQLGLDLQPSIGSVTFQPAQVEGFVELAIRKDEVPESSETFLVYLDSASSLDSTSPSITIRIDPTPLELIIIANDAPVRFENAQYRFEEARSTTAYSVTVTRGVNDDGGFIGPLDTEVSVKYQFQRGSAFEGSDYKGTDGSITFRQGETAKTVSFNIEADDLPEVEEYFTIRLLDLRGDAVLVDPSITRIIINANDNPSGIITFRPNAEGGSPVVRINEDTFTTVQFPVDRIGGSFGEVRVPWRVERFQGGSVSVSEDVGPLQGELFFLDGENEATITLTVVQDNTPEEAEEFSVLLDYNLVEGNGRVEGVIEAYLIIEDSDNVYGTVEFRPSTEQRLITSPSFRVLQLTLTRSGGRKRNLKANITASYEDATTHNLGDDDIFVSNMLEVTFLEGEDSVIASFELDPSAFLVVGGEFRAFITDLGFETEPRIGAFNSPRIGQRREVTILVSESEANGETGFFNVSNQVVNEPQSGIAEVGLLVSREGLSGVAVVRWSLSGKSLTPEDVVDMEGTITLQSGMSETILLIGIRADDEPEIDEVINVDLVSIEPSDRQRLRPGSTRVTITVRANDNPGGVLQFAPQMQSSYEVSEGVDSIDIIVERTGGALQRAVVQYAIRPNGDQEFFGATNILVFPPGEMKATGRVIAKDDKEPEVTETYLLELLPYGQPPAVLGARTQITITVKGSDNPYGIVHFQDIQNAATFTEEGQPDENLNVTLMVVRDMGTFGIVSVPWSISPSPQDDIVPSEGSLVFTPGEKTMALTLFIVNDKIPESDETYSVQLGEPDGGASLGFPTTTSVVITENDNPVEFTETVVYAREPSVVTLTIVRKGRVERSALIHYLTVDGSASHVERDFINIPSEPLEFAPGQREKTISVVVLEDNVPEGNETFTVQIFDVSGDLIVTNRSSVTIVIEANDDAYGVFKFGLPSEADVEEGSTAYFNVVRDKGSFGSVRVFWEIRTENNVPLADKEEFVETRGFLDFAIQENTQPLGITPILDNVPEVAQQYILMLTRVQVLIGLNSSGLASLASSGVQVTVRVPSSDDPYGRMAFSADARELSVAEDFDSGELDTTRATYIVERRQGTQDQIAVLWEIFSDQLGGNMPFVHDLLFTGQWSSTVSNVSSLKARPGTGTPVAMFNGALGSYVTVPESSHPELSTSPDGFSLSAWVQPFSQASVLNGYVIAKATQDGLKHYYSLRLITTATTTTMEFRLSTVAQPSLTLSVQSNTRIHDGLWHLVLVAVVNTTVSFYLDGNIIDTSFITESPLQDGPGTLLVGAVAPGRSYYLGYLQDVRIFMRGMESSSVSELYANTPRADVTPLSGILTYGPGVRTQTFMVSSLQDQEEEGKEVFSVILLDTKGGATLSTTDSRTTLSVLKSDNANGLFGFQAPCTPSRAVYENETIICTIERLRGDDDTVTITWVVEQKIGQGSVTEAVNDFVQSRGTVVFLPGERTKSFELFVRQEMIPELDEMFQVRLVSAVSADGLVGTTATSGASLDANKQLSDITIQLNDAPYGLLQFSPNVGVIPAPGTMIQPLNSVVQVSVGEEGGVIHLVVERAQGTLGQVGAEWRTKDQTALSQGKSPPDYVGAVGTLTIPPGRNYAFVNITVLDNSLPEAEKMFEVELLNPSGRAQLGPGSIVEVTVEASDGAFGIFQFADSALSVTATETGDQGFNILRLEVIRLGGVLGLSKVQWEVQGDQEDGHQDIVNQQGILEFEPGQSSAFIELEIVGETEPELDETMTVRLLQSLGGELGDPLKLSSTVTILANDDPYGKFVISPTFRPRIVLEMDQDIRIRVERLGGKFGTVEVDFASLAPTERYSFLPTPEPARAGSSDYLPTQGTLTFAEGEGLAEFILTILDDTLPERSESVFVRLTNVRLRQPAQLRPVANSPRLGSPGETYGQIIIDTNDDASGVLELSVPTISVEEGDGTPQIEVVRSGGSFGEVSVAFRTIDNTAVNELDYVALSRSITLLSGELRKRVPLVIIDDRSPELSETFIVELLNQITGGATLGQQIRTVVTILPSDDPNGVFSFVSPSETVEEADQPYTVGITVSRIGGSIGVVTVKWRATLNGIPPTADISPTSGSLLFVTNEGSQRLEVQILSDTIPEGAENILIELTEANNGGRIGESNTFTLTIAPNDSPHGSVELASAVFAVPEDPQNGPRTAQIIRSGGDYGRIRVFYSTSVMTLIDIIRVNGEKVVDFFSTAVLGEAPDQGTLVDLSSANDTLQACMSACLLESRCESFQFKETEEMGNVCTWFAMVYNEAELQVVAGVTYYWKIADKVRSLTMSQARPAEDFLVVTRESVLMENGMSTGNIPLPILDDTVPELEELFRLRLVDVQIDDTGLEFTSDDQPILGERLEATIVIRTNDNAFGVFRIYRQFEGPNVRTIEVEEADRLAVDFVVEREGGSIGSVTVEWGVSTVDRTATYNQDYIADGATLTFGVEQTRRVISITLLDDRIPENDEGLTIQLSNPTGGATLSDQDSIRLIILANDNVAGTLSFSNTGQLVNEGDQFNMTVLRSSPADGTVTVDWEVIGRNGLDAELGFNIVAGSLTFLPRETQKTIRLTALTDSTPEANEEYDLVLKNLITTGVGPTGAATIDPLRGSALITIASSNNPHGVFQLALDTMQVIVDEDVGTAYVPVDRKFGAIGLVRVYYEVDEGSLDPFGRQRNPAASGQDFVGVSAGFVDIRDGESSGTIGVIILNDQSPEIDEVFVLRLTKVSLMDSTKSNSPPTLADTGIETEIIITANDGAQGILQFAPDSRNVSVSEQGQDISLTVLRGGGTFGTVSVTVYTQPVTESTLEGKDYKMNTSELTFAEGESFKTIVLTIMADDDPEPAEVFNVILTGPCNGAKLGQEDKATVTILENDVAGGFISFDSTDTIQLEEPGNPDTPVKRAEILVSRGPGTFGEVRVPFIVTTQQGQFTVDVTPSAGVITFSDRQSSVILTLEAVNDDDPETEENFILTLQTPTEGSAILGAIKSRPVVVAASDAPFGMFEIFPAGNRQTSLSVEETFSVLEFDIVRSQGSMGRVSVDVVTLNGTSIAEKDPKRVVLAPVQTVNHGTMVTAWEQVTAGDHVYFVMLTSLASDRPLASLLPLNSGLGMGQSVIYSWQGQLVYRSTFTTDGATGATSFEINGITYLAVANGGREGTRQVSSMVYRVLAGGFLENVQGLPTNGASDIVFFTHNSRHFLFVANALDDSSRSDISSYVYEWMPDMMRFTSTPRQLIPTLYARAAIVARIQGYTFLAVANYYDRSTGSYEIRSTVYVMESDYTLVQHQQLATQGAVSVCHLLASNQHFLVFANNRQNIMDTPQDSPVYRWDSLVRTFVLHQNLKTDRALHVSSMTTDEGTGYLMFANEVGNSEIFVWSVEDNSFVSAWKGSPYRLLHPLKVPQTLGSLYLLASASVGTQDRPSIYQLGQVKEGSDFVPRRITMTFEPGQESLVSSVVILTDETPEDTETFTVALTSPTGGAELGERNSVPVSILSNDNAHGVIEFAKESLFLVVVEKTNADNTVTLNVVRNLGFYGQVVVAWQATGSHSGEGDITPLAGEVSFANGQSGATISLTIKDDQEAEFAEKTYITLTEIKKSGTDLATKGAVLGAHTVAEVTVLANDSPFGVVSWETSSVVVNEPVGTDSSIQLAVTRQQGLEKAINVGYVVTTVSNTPPDVIPATPGEDFVPSQGNVVMEEGVSRATVQVVIKQDDIPEAAEIFLVKLTSVSLLGGGDETTAPSIAVGGDTVEVVIAENDNARGVIEMDVKTNTEGRIDVYEEYGRNVTIYLPVKRLVGYFGSLVVTFLASPIEADVFDFSPYSGTVGFKDQQREAEIAIVILDDSITEPMETFEVKLVNVTNGANLGEKTSVRVAILKNDSPAGLFRFATSEVEAKESKTVDDPQGQVSLLVQRVQGTMGPVSVRWRISADGSEDFMPPLEGSVEFASGEVEKAIVLQTRPDNVLEGREEFIVSLITASNEADISHTDGDCKVIILPDQGSTGRISILPQYRFVRVGEPGESSPNYPGEVEIQLTRGQGIFGEVIVTWAITPRDLSAFLQVEGSVRFLDQQQTASIVLQTRDDSVPELKQTFTLELTSAQSAMLSPIASEIRSEVTFVASDYPHGLVQFALPEVITVPEEDQTISLNVERGKGLFGEIQVAYTTVQGTAGANIDYLPSAGVLTFYQNVATQIISVTLLQDSRAEGPEHFYVNLTSVKLVNDSNDYSENQGLSLDMRPALGILSTKTVRIDKNDNAEGTLQCKDRQISVKEESGLASIVVERTIGNFGLVSVMFQTEMLTATEGVDYLSTSGELMLETGVTEAAINVTVLDDSNMEPAETFQLILSDPTGGATLGPVTTCTVTILKSDYPNGRFAFVGETQLTVPNKPQQSRLTLFIERTGGVLGQQQLFWRIMGPNNPNLPLEDTSDVSHITDDNREVTASTLTWADAEAGEKSLILEVKSYTNWEVEKSFVIDLYRVVGSPEGIGNGEVDPDQGQFTLKVLRRGEPNGIVRFSGAATEQRQVLEPEGGSPLNIVFPITRREDTGTVGNIQVLWEVRSPNLEPSDVQPLEGSIVLEEGQADGQIVLQVLPDNIPELTETFTVVLLRVEGGAEIDNQFNTSTFSIRYNDDPHGQFAVLPEYQMIEVDSPDLTRKIRLNFTRFAGTFGSVVLTFTLNYDLTNIAGIGLETSTGTVTFNNGQANGLKLVTITGNGFLRVGTTFTVHITEVQYIGTGVTQAPVIRTGQSKTQIPVPALAANTELSFNSNIAFVNEEDNTVQVTLVRLGTYGSLEADWTSGYPETARPEGVVNGDTNPSLGSVSFAHGQEQANITCQVLPKMDRAEAFVLRLPRNPRTLVRGGARLGQTNLMVKIDPSGLIRFAESSLTLQASEIVGQVSLTVQRIYGSEGRVAVYFQTLPDTALTGQDFESFTAGVVTLAPLETSKSFNIKVYQDNIPEQEEAFYVNLTGLELFPTPLTPVKSPRLSKLKSLSRVIIKESNDPYGILSLRPTQVTEEEMFKMVNLTVARTSGTFGTVSVTVRTVGRNETWRSTIVPQMGSTSDNTIADVIGTRQGPQLATGGEDYVVLNTQVTFRPNEIEKTVSIQLLQDETPEETETVFVYLTNPTNGARIALGAEDGGRKGYSIIDIQANDGSNGLIGFVDTSITVNEDVNPIFTLTLNRLGPYAGTVTVYWEAKRSISSTKEQDAELDNQLKQRSGNTTCPAEEGRCDLTVELKSDEDPENGYSFIVVLTRAVPDAKLNEERKVAQVNVETSDDFRGLIQFERESRSVVVGENAQSVRLRVEKVKGQAFSVSVAYETQEMQVQIKVGNEVVSPAVDSQDFRRTSGALNFPSDNSSPNTIQITLTPVLASDNPLPVQFLVRLFAPTNGARINPDAGVAIVRIVPEEDVDAWRVLTRVPPEGTDFTDDDIIDVIVGLDRLAQGQMSPSVMNLIEDTLARVNQEGQQRRFPPKVLTTVSNLFCKLLDPSKFDARRGRSSLAQTVENFAYTLVTGAPCPPQEDFYLESQECPENVKISAGRWPADMLAGHKFSALNKDELTAPTTLPSPDPSSDGTNDECLDFHLIQYSSDVWFDVNKDSSSVMNSKVMSFGLKGQDSRSISDPVTFTIHTPEKRVATKTAKCVFFNTAQTQWTTTYCRVTNDLSSGQNDYVDCSCNHMSSYSVISSTKDDGIIGYVIWFYVTCAICMAFILIVVLVHHLCFSRPTFPSSLFMHFLMSVFFTQLCLVIDAALSEDTILALSKDEDNSSCIVMGVFLHYFFLSQFVWMAVQAINFWKVLIMNDEHSDRYYIVFFVTGWGVPFILVVIFYAVVYSILKNHTDIDEDFIYGDVNNNNEICFITNLYAALGGILGPVLVSLTVLGVVFVRAFQIASQWELYDDVYRARPNSKEVPLLLLVFVLVLLSNVWGGLHMTYGYEWMLVLYAVFTLILALLLLVLYAVIRNPWFARWFGPPKSSYSITSDMAAFPPPDQRFNAYASTVSMKGSRTSLINEAWESNTLDNRSSRMTVKRALPSQVYLDPPVAVISPAATIESDSPDFDDLIYALKMGRSLTPSELSRSLDDDMSQLSVMLDKYETRRIDIADTHL